MTNIGPIAAVVAVLSITALVGCADSGDSQTRPVTSSSSSLEPAQHLSAAELHGAREHLVASRVLPRLSVENSTLDAADFADEATNEDVAQRLEDDGFLGAAQRNLRGRSRSITGADSRVLVFDSSDGATSFTRYLAAHPTPFFGGPSKVKRLNIAGHHAVLIVPPLCDCAGAYPVYAALVPEGQRLIWLQLTGPRATAATLKAVLSPA